MTREEILYCLKADSVGYTESCNKCMYGDKTDVGTCYSKHLLAAIKALEQEPCEDAIRRADAIRIASGYCHPANIAKELAKLPSVNPAPCEDVPDINVGKCKQKVRNKHGRYRVSN